MPLSAITSVSGGTVDGNTGVKLYYGSSAAANLATINKDYMLGNVTTVDFSGLAIVRLNPSTYTVGFDANGGTPTPSSQSVVHGSYAAAPTTPTRDNHTFAGWYTAASGGTAWDFATDMVTGATTLYAHWAINQYAVTFDSHGGSTVDTQQVDHGSTRDRADAHPRGLHLPRLVRRRGRRRALGLLHGHHRGADPARGLEINSYTVSFDSDGGTPSTDQLVDHGSLATAPTAPELTGKVFPGGTPRRQAGRSGTSHEHRDRGHDSLRALGRRGHTVTFDSNGGSAVDDQDVAYGEPADVPTEPTRDRLHLRRAGSTSERRPA